MFARSLQNRDWLWPQDPHKNELNSGAGQALRGPYEVSCVLPFLTGQQVAPEEDISTKYVLRYRKEILERTVPAWKLWCLETVQFAQKMSVVAWAQCLSQCLQIQPYPRGSEQELSEL